MKQLHSPGIPEWPSLPPEIRTAILDTIVDLRLPRWSALASVSKEWQSVIGARNMAKLKLRKESCFEGFKTVVEQRHLVKHIYLSIELPSYPYHRIGSDPPRHQDYDHIIGEGIDRVASILSTWKTEGPLTLDLNATSPSDTQYWAKNFRFDDDHDADAPIPETGWHDPTHGWQKGVQTDPPNFSELQQLFMPVILGDHQHPARDPPPITAVTCLMIRRQFRRYFVPGSLDPLLGRLHRLSDLIYEPWSFLYTHVHPDYLVDYSYYKPGTKETIIYARVVGAPLPITLKRLIVFRDDNDFLQAANFQQDSEVQKYRQERQRLRDEGHRLVDVTAKNSHSLAQISLRLEELSASFVVDAKDFFKFCAKDWTWSHLHSLALTSRFLDVEKVSQTGSNALLLTMSTLVLRMPLLRTFVLWHGRKDSAGAFIYTRSEKYAHMVWRGNRHLDFSPEVLEAWSNVAKFHSSELRVRHEGIIEKIRCHGDAIYYLDLPCQVIEPTSLWQIRMEGPASRGVRP
ncbi:uncharacterized protein B0J16DRAFT_404314 [Fusarium flagelliforme]|uniref:DUF6546 domain-containing protein n=1 Tax=Fusarium flagelliforme TaxID=2675880 RepID=A0A395M5H1_9HYPO|nr:uncharacterized protein B0J16DRAFT_404314 [Fusarium flagelliforme]KAH7174566.1 hypothetical protein B0J16DRAFT_404314 [Fusarium flagelliforme]RFN42998.1 hypothetical protein FIE12Z_12659 [Fusarium flagelliforme]